MTLRYLYRVIVYTSNTDNKYSGELFEYLSTKEAAWQLWYEMTTKLGYKFVEVKRLNGSDCHPEKGWEGM